MTDPDAHPDIDVAQAIAAERIRNHTVATRRAFGLGLATGVTVTAVLAWSLYEWALAGAGLAAAVFVGCWLYGAIADEMEGRRRSTLERLAGAYG